MWKMPRYWKRKIGNQIYRENKQKNIDSETPNKPSKTTVTIKFSTIAIIVVIIFSLLIIATFVKKSIESAERQQRITNYSALESQKEYERHDGIIKDVPGIKINSKGWQEDRGSYISFETMCQNLNKSRNPIFFPLLTFYDSNNTPIYYACNKDTFSICGNNGFFSPFIHINKSHVPNYSYYEWRAVDELPQKMGQQ